MKQQPKVDFDLSEQFTHLKSAPIVEAVIHWTAKATKRFDKTELQRELGKRLPEYPQCQADHELQFGLEAQIGPNDSSTTQVRRDAWRGFRLMSSDKLHIVQFNRDGIVFSRLAPYDKWETFAVEGLRVWQVFVELAEPSEVQRLGVRFINRIAPVEIATVGKLLAKPPKCLEPLGLPLHNFLYQSAHDVPGHPYRVRVVQTVQPPPLPQTEGFGLLLDIDVITTQPFQPQDGTLDGHLERMHWLKNKAFFSLLSKKAVKLFEKGEK